MQTPNASTEPDSPDWELGVAAVARRFGIAPATLRSWHRRYGIGPSGHVDGRARRYRPADLARLAVMRDALIHGCTTAQAARYALGATPPDPPPDAAGDRDPHTDPGAGDGRADPVTPTPATETPATETRATEARARFGGRGLRLPNAGPAAHGLAHAVLAMDPDAIRSLLSQAAAAQGVVAMWDTVARPVLVAIAQRWADTGRGVEREHLLSECLLRVLDTCSGGAPAGNPRPVLLACVPDEWHSLPLSALAAALAERGVRSHLLGAAVPRNALHAGLRRITPAVAILWAQSPTADLDGLLRALPRSRPPCRWFVGGPGWSQHTLPANVTHLESLAEATDALSHCALGRQHQPRPV
jgi:DNA-binding transcriptional MerR regulator